MVSPPTGAGETSRRRVEAALAEVLDDLGVSADVDWTGRFYQYTHRLAHLNLLRVLNGMPAWLVFVHDVGDADIGGPNSRAEREAAIHVMHAVLALGARHRFACYVIDVWPEAGDPD